MFIGILNLSLWIVKIKEIPLRKIAQITKLYLDLRFALMDRSLLWPLIRSISRMLGWGCSQTLLGTELETVCTYGWVDTYTHIYATPILILLPYIYIENPSSPQYLFFTQFSPFLFFNCSFLIIRKLIPIFLNVFTFLFNPYVCNQSPVTNTPPYKCSPPTGWAGTPCTLLQQL